MAIKVERVKQGEYNVNTTYSVYEWDPEKDRTNQEKHGVSFEEAITVFEDLNALLVADLNHSDQEERFTIIGISNESRILYVCHCYRDPGDRIRIISARKATRTEVEFYERRLSGEE